jgi:hypothetical protein
MPSPRVSSETAYYLNGKVPAVALIAKGVRFPAGRWTRVASGTAVAWQVEELLKDTFPALSGAVVTFAALLTEFDVKEFERGLYGTWQ